MGKRKLLVAMITSVTTNALVLVVSYAYRIPISPSAFYGLLLTVILCLLIYRRHNWARWLLIVMLALNAFIVIVGTIAYVSKGMGLVGIVYVPFICGWIGAITLLLSNDVAQFIKAT